MNNPKQLAQLLLLSVITLSGCSLSKMTKMAQDQELTVTPNPLEVHSDTVAFTMSAKLPVKMLKKGKTYTVNTFYVYGDERVDVGSVEFRASDYPNAKTEQPMASESFSFPYEPEMRVGNLVVQGVAANENGKTKSTPEMSVAKGVITTSQLVQDYNFFAYANHGYNTGEELVPTQVEFYFPQGSARLRTSETRSSRGRFLDAFIAERNATRTVTIFGTHSPEGPERVNEDLSANRADAMQDYYRRQMRRFDYQGMADSIDFITKAVVESWDSLEVALNRDEKLTAQEKSEIMNIIGGSGSFEEKEDRLHDLSTYRYLLNSVYPDLRTATTEILTVKKKKTKGEIIALAKQISDGSVPADTLSDEELAYAASINPILKDKEKMYLAGTKESDSWQSHNNLGAVYVQMASQAVDEGEMMEMLDKATNQFDISMNRQASPEAMVNKAVVSLMRGEDTYEAIDMLQEAAQMNPSNEVLSGLQGVLGTLLIKTGDYQGAANALAQAPDTAVVSFNKGLAELLSDNYNQARASFDDAIDADPNMALAYYGAAITAARQSDDQRLADQLGMAIGRDAELRARATEDLEFDSYSESQSFQNAIK